MFLRKKHHLLRLLFILAEDFHGLAPRCLLPPVELAQIKHMPLHDPVVTEPAVFDHTPIEVLFAIFASFGTTEKHDDLQR
jgi:hypothetical protein